MREILPGVFHWVTEHPDIHIPVSSYWLDAQGVVLDPLVPADVGLDWFGARATPPRAVVLSIGLHRRHAERFVAEFGCSVHCHRAGLHRLEGSGLAVEPFDDGDTLPGGLVAHPMGGLAPDDAALHLPAHGTLALGDSVVRVGDDPIGFVLDSLMGDPPSDKARILERLRTLLDTLAFDHVLLAHGGPLLHTGRRQLEELVAVGGRTAWQG